MSSYARYYPAPTTRRVFVSYTHENDDNNNEIAESTLQPNLEEALDEPISSSPSTQLPQDTPPQHIDSTRQQSPPLSPLLQPPFISSIGDLAATSSMRTMSSTQSLSSIPMDMYSLLSSFSFFSGAAESEEFLGQICKVMRVRKYPAGDIIVRHGEVARAMFFITKGSLKVVSEDGEIEFGQLSQGTFFGEIGILFDVKRTATVVAKTNCTLVTLTAEDVHQTLENYPEIKEILKQSAIDRFMKTSKELERFGRHPARDTYTKLVEQQHDPMVISVASLTGYHRSTSTGVTDASPVSNPEQTEANGFELPHSSRIVETSKSRGSTLTIQSMVSLPVDSQQSTESSVSSTEASTPISAPSPSSIRPEITTEFSTMQSMLSSRLLDKRRVSVAVWSDDKLLQLAQNISNQQNRTQTRMQPSTVAFKSEKELEEPTVPSHADDSATKGSLMGISSLLQARIFRFLDFRMLMRLRRLNKSAAALLLDRSHKLCTKVDLSPWCKKIDDKNIGDIMHFCGSVVTTLILRNCWQITDEGLAGFSQYTPRLTSLCLASVWDITDDGLITLAENCRHLRVIELSNCRKLTDYGVLGLFDRCSRIEYIGLGYCKNLSDNIMERRIWGVIKRANLQRCTGIFDGGFLHWQQQLPLTRESSLERFSGGGSLRTLQEVDARSSDEVVGTTTEPGQPQSCWGVSQVQGDAGNTEIIQLVGSGRYPPAVIKSPFPGQSYALQELNLSDCSFLTDQTIVVLSERCPLLRKLCLSFCCSLSEKFAEPLSKGCPRIHTLDVSFCGGAMTDASINVIIDGMCDMQRLSLRGCIQVTDLGVEALLQRARKLKVLNLSQCKSVSREMLDNAGRRVKLASHVGFFDEEFPNLYPAPNNLQQRRTTIQR